MNLSWQINDLSRRRQRLRPGPFFCLAFLAVVVLFAPIEVKAAETPGFTVPFRDIDLPAVDSGVIAELLVQEGDRVVAGQEVGRLETDLLQATLDVAEAARLAVGRKRSAEAEARLYRQRFDRLRTLLDKKHATAEEVEQAAITLEVAEAKLLTVVEELQVRELECRRIEVQLRQRMIRSPIDGVVTRIVRDVGEFVGPGDPVVMNVVQLDPLLAVFAVPEAAAAGLQVGAEIPLTIGSGRQSAIGTVQHIAARIDSQSNTIEVKLRVANPDLRFRAGEASFLTLDLPSTAPRSQATLPVPLPPR